jgi:hypothetical protein
MAALATYIMKNPSARKVLTAITNNISENFGVHNNTKNKIQK